MLMMTTTTISNQENMIMYEDDEVNVIAVVRVRPLMELSICRRDLMAAASIEGIHDRCLRQQGQNEHVAVEVAMHAFPTPPVAPLLVELPSIELHTWPVLMHTSTQRQACVCSPMGSVPSLSKNEDSSSRVPHRKREGMAITHSICALAR